MAVAVVCMEAVAADSAAVADIVVAVPIDDDVVVVVAVDGSVEAADVVGDVEEFAPRKLFLPILCQFCILIFISTFSARTLCLSFSS